MAINTEKMTLQEKMNLREQLEAEIKVDEVFEEAIKSYLRQATDSREYYSRKTVIVGTNEEQAVNSDGEALYSVKGQWRRYTMREIKEDFEYSDEQIENLVTPYYENITETVEVSVDDMDNWDKLQYDGLTKVINTLTGLLGGN